MLARKVAAGELPPLSERLPEEPLVIQPDPQAGVYGGTWHFDVINRRDVNLVYHISNPSFLRWDRDGIRTLPHLCKDFNVSGDGRVWTFHLRKGVKWSDGEPFTIEDVRFWYEDDTMNRDINPTPRPELQISGESGEVRIVDDLTFQVVFPDSNRGFHQNMTTIILFFGPSHYLKQFHVDHADPIELDQRIKAVGVQKWSELFKRMDRWYDGFYNPDRPTLRPWMLSKGRSSPNTFVFERNPYYWAVDTDGRQLPYIDSIMVQVVSNDQVLAMKTIAGDFDFQWRRLDFKDYPLLKENEERHDYTLLTWPQDRGSDATLYLNYTCTHPVVGPLLRDRRFRIALSQAINRDELNLLFYKNIGVPRQATAAEVTPYFVPEHAQAYASYDPAEANRLLDEMGLTTRDKAGYRSSPSGESFFLFVETSDLDRVDMLQIVCEHWRAVGINAEVRVTEGSLLITRTQSGEIMIQCRPHGSFIPPTVSGRSDYIAPLYGLWHGTSGQQGQEPTKEFKQLYLLGEQRRKSDVDEEIVIMKRVYQLYAENVWAIGLVGEVPALLARKNYFMNVPDKSLYSYARGRRLQLSLPEQYWMDPTRR
ncbi:MAG: ABC transporter substrate-binding protein [Fidelibacterota bacterium]|nr:MAG: ABC transporter substrate-binding protein [Candidatus Neomarinimicrobiota bacterium]